MIWPDVMLREWSEGGGITPFDGDCVNPASIDLKISNKIRTPDLFEHKWSEKKEVDRIIFKPSSFLLCSTVEYIKIPIDAVGKMYLKSTFGRKGFEHLHACYVDPGFEGTLTLELCNHWPGIIYLNPGERLVQLVLCQLINPCGKDYSKTGHYYKQVGPTPHRY